MVPSLISPLWTQPSQTTLDAVCAAAGCTWITASAPVMASADSDEVTQIVDLIMSSSPLGAILVWPSSISPQGTHSGSECGPRQEDVPKRQGGAVSKPQSARGRY